MTATKPKTLAELKVGDKVAVVDHSTAARLCRIRTVEAVTDKQVVVAGCRYWKKDGRRTTPSSAWRLRDEIRTDIDSPRVREMVDRARRSDFLDRVRRLIWAEISLNKLERIVAILNEPESQGEQ